MMFLRVYLFNNSVIIWNDVMLNYCFAEEDMMDRRHDAKIRKEFWQEKLKGLSLEEACRAYLLNGRPPQYIAVQPVREEEFVFGMHLVHYRRALKRFLSTDTGRNHCCSKEELLAETSRMTGLPEHESERLLHRLFGFQPELTYNNFGARCKPENLAIPVFKEWAGEVAVPYDILKKDLPDEWYISLQIPEKIIDRMVWGIRKAGSTIPHPCSSIFAERVLRLYKRRRGEFIRKYSFDFLKFLWLEYGSIHFPLEKIQKTVAGFADSGKE